jgi:hypothetical protein
MRATIVNTNVASRSQALTLALLALLTLLALLLFLVGGCASTSKKETVARPTGTVAITMDPAVGVELTVDGRYRGLNTGPLKLTAGTHRLEFAKDGYFVHYEEVEVFAGKAVKVVVKLRKRPF